MILLDANVVSETMRQVPDPVLVAWLESQIGEELCLSSHVVAEIAYGIGIAPPGRRKEHMKATLSDLLSLYEGRILPFDQAAALHYADLAVAARAAGRGFPVPDSYMAAIASLHGFAVASRDKSAFVAAGVRVIDPWAGS